VDDGEHRALSAFGAFWLVWIGVSVGLGLWTGAGLVSAFGGFVAGVAVA
jgi:hypothetical protein